ncbi:MAG: LptF/LptG family permease [Gammaproteobacteria bacterium]|nr:LptF/LptG family permease [Gammaproteobacteria bacterium]
MGGCKCFAAPWIRPGLCSRLRTKMIISRYLYREIGARMVWLLLLLLLLTNAYLLARFTSSSAAAGIPVSLLFDVMRLKLVTYFPELLSLSMFLALLSCYARLTHDRELPVMAGSGLGLGYHLRLSLLAALPAALLAACCAWLLAPRAEAAYAELLARLQRTDALAWLSARQFHALGQGRGTVYIEAAAEGRLSGVYYYFAAPGARRGLLVARRASFEEDAAGRRLVRFEDGTRYDLDPRRLAHKRTRFRSYRIQVPQRAAIAKKREEESMSLRQLWQRGTARHLAEVQRRASQVVACLLLAPFAVLLQPRMPYTRRRYGTLLLGIGVYLLYYNLMELSHALLARGRIPPPLGWGGAHLLALAALLALAYRRRRPGPAAGSPRR